MSRFLPDAVHYSCQELQSDYYIKRESISCVQLLGVEISLCKQVYYRYVYLWQNIARSCKTFIQIFEVWSRDGSVKEYLTKPLEVVGTNKYIHTTTQNRALHVMKVLKFMKPTV